jgi:predicted TPR repeat methyltransferase
MPAMLRDRWRATRATLAPPYWHEVLHAVGPAKSVLDVGCGSSSPLAEGRDRFERLVGVDAFPESIEASRARGLHDELIELDVRKLGERFSPRTFDAVVAVDLLEHLERSEGLELLAEMERIARQRTVVFTPNGYVEQGARGANPFQVHRSGWSVSDLESLGYRVTGVNGLRLLRGEEASIRFRPKRAWSLAADLTQPLVRRVPQLAFHLLAVKEVGPT